jgi:hypothetical protein
MAIAWAGAALSPAASQAVEIERIERVAGLPNGSSGRSEGVRIVRPGALLIASFDRDGDGLVTAAELSDGAGRSFAFADRNSDGVLGGFEQSDWAAAVGAAEDVLSNPMLFDTDLDRSVTREEFLAGVRRLSDPLVDARSGAVPFAVLIQPLAPAGRAGEALARTGPDR